jgi:acyl carrier protein
LNTEFTDISELRAQIQRAWEEVFADQHEGMAIPAIADDSILLESGLDSLGFAILVTNLEEELGYDAFSLSSDAFYPRTFGEFVHFYYDNRPR